MAENAVEPRLYAVVAEFDREGALLDAAKAARSAGYRRLEAFSPFPVEGLAEAIGFHEKTIAPVFFFGGITGAALAYGLQVYVNLAFPLNIGGRPLLPPPAFALVTFEMMVLGAVLCGLGAMLLLNRLPRLHHPMFEIESFHLASEDKFFLAVLSTDAQFDPASTRRFLKSLRPVRVDAAPFTEAPE